MSLYKTLSAPLFGNIVGIASLVVGIFSLILTIFTYHKAKKIEKSINNAQARAIDKKSFAEYRRDATKNLKVNIQAAKKAEQVSKGNWINVFDICQKLKGYDQVLLDEDLQRIESLCKQLKPLIDNDIHSEDKDITYFLEISNDLIRILNKGEYDV